MSDTKVKIIEAALKVFPRYGIRRVSMGDVAEAAGISRQTLYAHYSNKDELFAATMTEVVERIMRDLNSAWENCDTIDQKIDAYFEHAVYGPFKMLQHLPDIKDLLFGVGQAATNVAKQAELVKSKQLAEHFSPYETQLAKVECTPLAIGEFIVRTSSEFKYSADNLVELNGFLCTLKSCVLAMIGHRAD